MFKINKNIDKLNCGKIIYYGLGVFGKRLFSYVLSKNEVIAIIDKNYINDTYFSYNVSHPDILKKIYPGDYDLIMVSVVDKSVFQIIQQELVTNYNIPQEKIIWLYEKLCSHMKAERMARINTSIMNSLFNKENKAIAIEDKQQPQHLIKVRIMYGGAVYLWNTLRSLCIAFENDSKCEIQIIIKGSFCSTIYDLIKQDIPNTIYEQEYTIEEDQPDIFIMSPYAEIEKELIKRLRNNSKYLCQIPAILVSTAEDINQHITPIMNNLNSGFDLSIHDRLLYKEIIQFGVKDSRIVEIGNPKFDNIYNIIHSNIPLPEEWKKLEGKRVVLWTTDHGWSYGNITFDLYFDKMIKWFQEHQDMGLIFRPHPLYIQELLENKIWSQKDLNYFKSSFRNSINMIYDDTPDYSLAYRTAHGILCDVNCGIIISALPLGKPLGTMRRYDDFVEAPLHPNVADKLYTIDSPQALFSFLEMVENGEDTRKEEREYAFKYAVSHFDGKNGERIKEYIIKKYLEKWK